MTELSTINLNQHNIHEWAILDSGATSHFLLTTAPTTNKKAALNPLHVTMPDGDQVQSTHTCDLDIPQLPANARDGHIVPGLAAHSLLSIVKLCNAGCDVTLSKIKCEVKYRGRLVMRGSKCTRTGLWFVNIDRNRQIANLAPKISGTANLAINHGDIQHTEHQAFGAAASIPTSSKAELAMFHHQTLGSPLFQPSPKQPRTINSVPSQGYQQTYSQSIYHYQQQQQKDIWYARDKASTLHGKIDKLRSMRDYKSTT